jgi:hypothetical protein
MSKEELKEQLEKVKAQIKTNSKDAHFAEKLIDELLSIKGQLSIEPTFMHIELKDIEKIYRDSTGEMFVTKNGYAVYHVYGGYTIIADVRMQALHHTIADLANTEELIANLDEETKEAFELDMSASRVILNAPMVSFSDVDMKFESATQLLRILNEAYDRLVSKPLQDETPEENANFEAAAIALEEAKKLEK